MPLWLRQELGSHLTGPRLSLGLAIRGPMASKVAVAKTLEDIGVEAEMGCALKRT